ncbi:hypothetical protein C6497_15600 [Candidatus Poribacteria bacterium]|nr:MAG: hypothetical protein C6497_15600 [Candidatus Poribacteria bacterium]
MSSLRFFSNRARQQSELDVSPKLREQIVNIVDDLVERISPGYLLPNIFFPLNYEEVIYKEVYIFLWNEFGMRRFENANYRHEVFDFLREVPSEKFFNVIECLLKVVYDIVHIQIMIPDNIIPNPHAGNELWSRKESVRNRHISFFKEALEKLNHRLSQNNAKYRYEMDEESVQIVRFDNGLDVPKDDSSIQEKDNNQTPEHPHNQSRSEFWSKKNYIISKKNYIIGVVGVIFVILDFAFGNAILKPLLHWLWNYLQPLLQNIATIFR